MTVTRRGPGRRRCELVLRFQYGRTGDGGAFLSMLRFALASALAVTAALPAVAPPRVLDGFAGNGRRFRHGPWTSVRFSAGAVRCWLLRPGETPAPRGVSSRFGLRNRPEVCRWGSRVARGARRHCGEQERGFRQAVSVWSLWGRSVPHAHRGMGVAWRRRRVRTVAMHHDEGRLFHDNISRTAWRPQPRISRSGPR